MYEVFHVDRIQFISLLDTRILVVIADFTIRVPNFYQTLGVNILATRRR